MTIQKRIGAITAITDLSPTAREVITTLVENGLPCPAGSFVNMFMNVAGVNVRRAFSVVATDPDRKTLTLSIRRSINGTMTPEFWKSDIIGRRVEIMGPMGANTSDKFTQPHVFLFAFGIGAGVIKAIAADVLMRPHVTKLTIVTGSRNEEDIIYRSYFDSLAREYAHVHVRYVVSDPIDPAYPFVGYIQQHVSDQCFQDADIYLCGQEAACAALIATINATEPRNCMFFIEAFH